MARTNKASASHPQCELTRSGASVAAPAICGKKTANAARRMRIEIPVVEFLSRAILVRDRPEDQQIGRQSNGIDDRVVALRAVDEQERHAVQPFDAERRRESQEQRVTGLAPEFEEERCGDQRGAHDHAEQESFDHDASLSKMRPYTISTIETAPVASRQRYRFTSGKIVRSAINSPLAAVNPAKHRPHHSSSRLRVPA